MSKNLAREEVEEDIHFDLANHIPDKDLISNCRLLNLPCRHSDSQNFIEAFYRYPPINSNCEIRFLNFHNQSAQDIPLPRTSWNNRNIFRVGLNQETRQNLQNRYNNNRINIRTQVPVDRFQIHSPEVQGVFPIDRIVRQGSLPVDFIHNGFCPSKRDQRYFAHARTYREWLVKVEQFPPFYVVTYERRVLRSWRDRALPPSWNCTFLAVERSSTGRLIHESTEVERTHFLTLIQNEKIDREEVQNARTWAVQSCFINILNPYCLHIIYLTLMECWKEYKQQHR
jgi:hypothetical protein